MPWLDAAWHPPAWVDGPLPWDAADRGLLLGDGLFDTALVLGGRVVWRPAHVSRLLVAARSLGISVEEARIDAAIDGVLARAPGPHGTLRLTVTRGAGPRGLAPPAEAIATILAATAPLRAAALFAPLRLQVADIRRNETSPLSRVKSLCYGDGVLASAAAMRAGCDDALFLNNAGHVACTTVGNLFAIGGGELVTPPLNDGVLPGVTRAVVMGLAQDLGLAATERSLGLDELQAAEAILCTNSLRLVAPVLSIGRRGAAAGAVASAFAARVAADVAADVGIDPRTLADT